MAKDQGPTSSSGTDYTAAGLVFGLKANQGLKYAFFP